MPPKIAFILLAYNQESFIREAVHGALSQTFSPLSIILSDDCSPDNTFEIMEEIVRGYDGPHHVILNRTPRNMGLMDHINSIGELVDADFVVFAAGDDISLSNRVEAIVNMWLDAGKPIAAAYSDVSIIDRDSKVVSTGRFNRDYGHITLPQFVANPYALGCSYGFSSELIRSFAPLNNDLQNEDFIWPLRALLLHGQVLFVDKKLVRYRMADDIGHNAKIDMNSEAYVGIRLKRADALWRQVQKDVMFTNCSDTTVVERCQKNIERVAWRMLLFSEKRQLEVIKLSLRRMNRNPSFIRKDLVEILDIKRPSQMNFIRRMIRDSYINQLRKFIRRMIMPSGRN
jgi:glycosyltransferase involved in cell wall biosynthesis